MIGHAVHAVYAVHAVHAVHLVHVYNLCDSLFPGWLMIKNSRLWEGKV